MEDGLSSPSKATGLERPVFTVMRILYDDASLIFIDKPPGLVVQRGYDADEPVLVEMVQEMLRERGEVAFLMQRLDRGTSGVIFFSKQSAINANLTKQFEKKKIKKTYLALAEGDVAQEQLIDAPLARIGPISFGVRDGGKRAITHVEPLEHSPGGSFLRIDLRTGRTHQIRAHLAAIGHPLAGDWLYGERNASRPMLHASRIDMLHPGTGAPLSVTADLAADFLKELTDRGLKATFPNGRASGSEDELSSRGVSNRG